MTEIVTHLIDQPIPNLITLADLFFLFIAAVGKISGKIEPDASGRILCGVLGILLLPAGLLLHHSKDDSAAEPAVTPATGGNSPAPAVHISGACVAGYVWRLAVADDHVCVTQETRDQVESDNKLAPARVMNGGGYGADTCISGFVWREAVPQDHVCVPQETRAKTWHDNELAATRIMP
jgi:hypothetical protein